MSDKVEVDKHGKPLTDVQLAGREYAKRKREHPTVSDVALALATRQTRPAWTTKLRRNAAGNVEIDFYGEADDALVSAQTTADTFDSLCARYPRENGAS